MGSGIEFSIDGENTYVGSIRRTARPHKGKSLLAFPDRYVVVDLETTGFDARFSSIIEVAGIKFENGQEAGRFQSLVKPHMEISEYITELTGISNEMVESAPIDDVVLPEFYGFISDCPVVAHNANFDVNFLYDCASDRVAEPFSNDFVDTLRLARRLYPDLPNHKLSTLASCLGIITEDAHRALADCLTAHACFLKLKEEAERRGGIPEFPSDHFNNMSKTITARTSDFNPDSPVFGMAFAFTGKLERMTRKEAMQAVADAGGILCDGVVSTTNYLVLGNNDYCEAIQGGKSNKQKKAEKMRLSGYDISIISEDVFYDMLED